MRKKSKFCCVDSSHTELNYAVNILSVSQATKGMHNFEKKYFTYFQLQQIHMQLEQLKISEQLSLNRMNLPPALMTELSRFIPRALLQVPDCTYREP